MEKIKEEVPEKLRIAVLLSFISGYINAFTYNNAGELFAGAQTGNVIFMALHFAKGNLEKAVEFLIPIISFMIGQIFIYCFREREYILDIIERYCGARLTHNNIKIGGVFLDLPSGWCDELLALCEKILNGVKDYEDLLDTNRIWLMRTQNVGVISQKMALGCGCSGVMLRASGHKWDIRKEEPYLIYDELDFDVPFATAGDCYARYKCYMGEIRESVKILRQCVPLYHASKPEILAQNPEFVNPSKEQILTQNYSLMQHFVLITQGLKAPRGEIYHATESPKGELGFYIYSTGESRPYRVKIRTPSFFHCAIYEKLLVGQYIADVSAIIGSTNIILGEVDR